jgi:hypothetical protein
MRCAGADFVPMFPMSPVIKADALKIYRQGFGAIAPRLRPK